MRSLRLSELLRLSNVEVFEVIEVIDEFVEVVEVIEDDEVVQMVEAVEAVGFVWLRLEGTKSRTVSQSVTNVDIELLRPFQLQEYQTDMRRCRFDTPGKLIPAHRAQRRVSHSPWTVGVPWAVGECGTPTVH